MLKTGCSVLSRCIFMSRIDGLMKKREVVPIDPGQPHFC